jgi:hypothetical protein
MADYQLTATEIVIRTVDGAGIPDDPENRDRQTYDAWLADGGVPDPYVPPPVEPPVPTPGDVANLRLDAGIQAANDSVVGVAERLLQMPPHGTPPTVEELQAQMDYLAAQCQVLADATRSMLEAQATTTG